MTKKTPEQRSLDRYPDDAPPYGVVYPNEHKRDGYATCIREEVEPLEAQLEQKTAENANLRDAGNVMCMLLCLFYKEAATPLPAELRSDLLARVNAWGEAAKQEGFVPTNTEDQ